MVKIIIDRHEKDSLIASELVEGHAEIEFKNLPVGDYLIGNIAIERKTVRDFIGSMLNKRLVRQLGELKQYPVKILLIEGVDEEQLYNDNAAGVHANAIRGMLLSIMLDFQIPVLLAYDYRDSAKFLMLLAKRFENSGKEISLRARKKAYNTKEQQQFILEGFPGIGPATAKKLLSKFKTIKRIISAPVEALKEEIGKKAEIFRIVEAEF